MVRFRGLNDVISFLFQISDLYYTLISVAGYALQHCYFNPEWVGEYVLQIPPGGSATGVNVQIPQSRLSIGLDSIPIFGECYQRRGNNFLLIERLDFHEGVKNK